MQHKNYCYSELKYIVFLHISKRKLDYFTFLSLVGVLCTNLFTYEKQQVPAVFKFET